MTGTRLVLEQARKLEFDLCLDFHPALLVPEERIRAYCIENRCGSYNSNHMCPPRVGSLEDMEAVLGQFTKGVLLQYSRRMEVANDREGVIQTKMDFHRLVLRLERRLNRRGTNLERSFMSAIASSILGSMSNPMADHSRSCSAVQTLKSA